MTLPFIKMHGLGNDFVILDFRGIETGKERKLTQQDIIKLADRRLGIGCDQVIVMKAAKTEDIDCVMEIYNADGSMVSTCGNATRCVAKLLGQNTARITAGARVLVAHQLPSGDFAVNMGRPLYGWQEIPLAHEVPDVLRVEILDLGYKLPLGACVNMGNPHIIFFDPPEDLAHIGPALERYTLFPERVNVSFAKVLARDSIELRTWERGAGQTAACGSAACASVAAGYRLGLLEAKVAVHMRYGQLGIEIDAHGDVVMSGPAVLVARGEAFSIEPL